MVRRVLSARWSELDDPAHLRFEIRATAFCHQMVRSIVGTLVDVGLGKALARRRPRDPRRPRPGGRRPGRPAVRPRAVGGRLPVDGRTLGTGDDDGPPHARRPARRARRDRRPPARGRPHASGAPGPRSSTPCAGSATAFTADELAAAVPDVHVSTVYRTLALLEEIGAVRHVHLSHGPALYEHAASAEVRHLVCEVCDRHVAVPAEVFDAVRDRLGRRVRLRPRRLALRHRRPLPRPRLSAGRHPAAGRATNGAASGSQFGSICDRFACRVRPGKGADDAGDAHPGRVHRRPDVARSPASSPSPASPCACGSRPGRSTSAQVPVVGLVAAFVFAVQMLNFPVANGTSGHLLGGVLAAVLVGPCGRRAAPSRSCSSCRRCCSPTAACRRSASTSSTWRWSARSAATRVFLALRRLLGRSAASVPLAAGLAAVTAPVLAAVAFTLEYAIGGNDAVSVGAVAGAMIGVHVLIGIGEGIITALAVGVGDGDATRPRLRRPGPRTPAPAAPAARAGVRLTWPIAAASRCSAFVAVGLAVAVGPRDPRRARAPARAPTGSRRSPPTQGIDAGVRPHVARRRPVRRLRHRRVSTTPPLGTIVAGLVGVAVTFVVVRRRSSGSSAGDGTPRRRRRRPPRRRADVGGGAPAPPGAPRGAAAPPGPAVQAAGDACCSCSPSSPRRRSSSGRSASHAGARRARRR